MRIFYSLAMITLAFANTVSAGEPAFPASRTIGDTELTRCSTTKIKAFRLIHVGYAALYMKDCKKTDGEFFDEPKLMSFFYTRDIPKRAFSEAAIKTLEENIEPEFFEEWKNEFAEINEAYRDTEEGDQYDISFINGKGLQLFFNDELIVSNQNDKLASQYFQIWFGENPFN